MNNLTINVYLTDEDGDMITPVYKSKRPQEDPYNFLMITTKEDPDKWHYAWIMNLDKLLMVNKVRRNLITLNKLTTGKPLHRSAL